jgi:hypothetical protein
MERAMGIEPTSEAWESACATFRSFSSPKLAVILAVPTMFKCWQVGPVLFTRQRLPSRFALRLCQKHSAQIVATIYCVESIFRFRLLVVDYLEERMRRSSPTPTFNLPFTFPDCKIAIEAL